MRDDDAREQQERKPFRLEVTREWCEKMAHLEQGHEVGAGGLSAPPRDEMLALLFQYRDDMRHPVTSADNRARRIERIDAAIAKFSA